MIYNRYYCQVIDITEDGEYFLCLVQCGNGNTIDTSNMVSILIDIKRFKKLNFLIKQFYFELIIEHNDLNIKFHVNKLRETKFLNDLFKKPNYFEGLEDSVFFKER